MSASVSIDLVADWEGLQAPLDLGVVRAQASGGGEIFSLAWDAAVLQQRDVVAVQLDPDLGWWPGPQYPRQGRGTFGLLQDASPDRWGRMLMDRRRERDRRAGRTTAPARLRESDYLLGVHDTYRLGGLRLRGDTGGPFLDDQHDLAAPPMVRLRELEAASLALEEDTDNTAAGGDAWLQLLIAPGGSLGGARPKASVVDHDGSLWIAKFPSPRDRVDVGGWELVLNTLARGAGLQLPESQARKFASANHTFIVRRFDRTTSGRRLHMASAMTLTGHQDGDGASTGVSYLELADVLIHNGVEPAVDLQELWRRIVFNLLVSNTDDHLRNHAFLLESGLGWRLAPAYDLNPDPSGTGLRLNITATDNALDLELAMAVAANFRIAHKQARLEIERMQQVVRSWRRIAAAIGISAGEQDRMADAFKLAIRA